jgi:hypothetical protein
MCIVQRKKCLPGFSHVTLIVLTCWFLSAAPAWPGQDVWTSRNDGARTGANLNETLLTTSNVNPKQFGQLFSYSVKGNIFAQPLVIRNVRTASGLRNLVYVATTEDLVYAFDADSNAQNGGLIWTHSFTGNGITPIPFGDPAHTAYAADYGCPPPSPGQPPESSVPLFSRAPSASLEPRSSIEPGGYCT